MEFLRALDGDPVRRQAWLHLLNELREEEKMVGLHHLKPWRRPRAQWCTHTATCLASTLMMQVRQIYSTLKDIPSVPGGAGVKAPGHREDAPSGTHATNTSFMSTAQTRLSLWAACTPSDGLSSVRTYFHLQERPLHTWPRLVGARPLMCLSTPTHTKHLTMKGILRFGSHLRHTVSLYARVTLPPVCLHKL